MRGFIYFLILCQTVLAALCYTRGFYALVILNVLFAMVNVNTLTTLEDNEDGDNSD